MASYYYLIASLPTLKTEGENAIDYPAFLELCKPNVSASVYRTLENLVEFPGKAPMARAWKEFYEKLMGELNYRRNVQLGKTVAAPADRPSEAVEAVNAAMAAKNPLEAEKILLEYEFRYLDSLLGMHYFDEYVLFGYAIKLKLLERRNSFDHNKGKEEFRSLFEDVQRRVLSL